MFKLAGGIDGKPFSINVHRPTVSLVAQTDRSGD